MHFFSIFKRGRFSSVGSALDCRAGGRRFDSRGRNNSQSLKITEKWWYSLCTAGGGTFAWLVWLRKMAVPSPVGDVQKVPPISTFVLNTLTLKWSACFFQADHWGMPQETAISRRARKGDERQKRSTDGTSTMCWEWTKSSTQASPSYTSRDHVSWNFTRPQLFTVQVSITTLGREFIHYF